MIECQWDNTTLHHKTYVIIADSNARIARKDAIATINVVTCEALGFSKVKLLS